MTEDYGAGDFDEDIEDEERPCDYGADSPCVEPRLRNMGNCFECWLYLEMCEDQETEQRKKKEAQHKKVDVVEEMDKIDRREEA